MSKGRSSAWPNGSTKAWRKVRAAVLERDGHRCQLQVPGKCETRADCVHHLYGRAITGDDPAYLVGACTPCNQHIGDPNRAFSASPERDPAPKPWR